MELHDEVRRFCRDHGLFLKKGLGQHFLVHEPTLKRIVTAARIAPTDDIVEIGPGIGTLTRELLKCARRVTAIELDHRLIPFLKESLTTNPSEPDFIRAGYQRPTTHSLTIIQGNALKIPMPTEQYKIVANIPYHITSPLLRHLFLESETPPVSLTLLMQREVAEKICDGKKAGLLTVLVGLFGIPRIVSVVPPTAFLPPPKVESAVLHVDCFPEPIAERETIERTFTLTKTAFGGKRKMLRNTIGKMPDGTNLLAAAGIDASRRPESLSIHEWVRVGQISSFSSDSSP